MSTFIVFTIAATIYALIGYFGVSRKDMFIWYIVSITIASIVCPIAAHALLPAVNLIALLCFEVTGLIVGALIGIIPS